MAATLMATGVVYVMSPATVAAEQVNQGDALFRVGSQTVCTAGYIDSDNKRIFTAGHCGPDGSHWEYRGTAKFQAGEMRNVYLPGSNAGDWGFVEVVDRSILGRNLTVAHQPAKSISVGDEICAYSRKLAVVSCAQVKFIEGSTILTDGGIRITTGDSGGPAWSRDGFVGVISGLRIDPDSKQVVNVRITKVDPTALEPGTVVGRVDKFESPRSSLLSLSSSGVYTR